MRAWQTEQPLSLSERWKSLDVSSILFSLTTTSILINAYKVIALSNDLPNVILVLTLDWRPAALLEKLFERKLMASDVARYFVFASGLYLVCACNFRLRLVPWKMSMHFLLCTGLAQIFSHWKINVRKPYLRPAMEHDQASPRYWMLFALTGVGIYSVFQPERIHPDRSPTSAATVFTALLSTVSTSSLYAFGPSLRELQRTLPSSAGESFNPQVEGTLLRLAVAGLIIASDSALFSRPLNISFWQYLGYAVASWACLLGEQTASADVHGTNDKIVYDRGWTRRPLAFLAGGAWICALLNSLTTIPTPLEYASLALDPSPSPASDFDLVIARYAEPAEDVARRLDLLLAADSVRSLRSRVLIYNKNDDTSAFEQALRAEMLSRVNVSFHTLENIGREGDTYLHHILTNWDHLATHTLFAQAEPDGLSSVVRWIDNFFIPETGFLQLSYEGRMCTRCEHCGDWTDDPDVVFDLYGLANPGKQCRNLVWTFRGQFIVSGARIRANGKSMYQHLLKMLSDPGSDTHASQYTNSVWHSAQKDTLNDPVFGFTLERFWGILMQCSEPRVGYWSPSQFAVTIRPKWLAGSFPHDHTQCLDRPPTR
ncbi:unnamed protein product [Zymoseptoria tritici ST99CH_1A5]|uniref:Uncharacterized protein n=1 Tax=Zymoseptoria tritici ST99CH_1A5 TaxID=1276529 RepID=A0A1Y6LTP8_ZYMTR|nr:unnamed protein product [Zymoseptoria tritici ST99CH_1A5]